MNLYFRLILVLLASIGKPKLHPLEPTSRTFRVWPFDIDLFFHMNNGRYSQIMDVARVHWMRRSRVLDSLVKNRWSAVLGGSLIRFRRSLKPFHRYRVWTELVSWDDRWFFLEHRFETMSGRPVAIALTRAALRKKRSWIGTDMVVGSIFPSLNSPPHPPRVQEWLDADRTLDLQDKHSLARNPKHKKMTKGEMSRVQ